MIARMLSTLIGGIVTAGAATFAGWHTMAPTSQLYGRTFIGVEPGSRRLALTYDDGPNDPYTQHLLDVLDRHAVKATFFVIGRFVQQRPNIARTIVERGHAIGSHTWDHPNLILVNQSNTRVQLEKTQKAIFDATGVAAKLFRPPFGGRRPATLRTIRQLGLRTGSMVGDLLRLERQVGSTPSSPTPSARSAAVTSFCCTTAAIAPWASTAATLSKRPIA